jgi:hypothetical protein
VHAAPQPHVRLVREELHRPALVLLLRATAARTWAWAWAWVLRRGEGEGPRGEREEFVGGRLRLGLWAPRRGGGVGNFKAMGIGNMPPVHWQVGPVRVPR